MPSFFLVLTSILLPTGAGAETVDPADDGSQFAWSENTGWLNAEPLGDGGPGMHVAARWARGWLWFENAGWISLSCENTASCSTISYRVEVDGSGALSGYAWSENAGWIGFSCANTGSCATVDYGVEVDLRSGELTGFAWSENLGWISFSCTSTASCATVDYGVETVVPLSDEIFSDGFESGGTLMWSVTLP